jgi:hypothetical protein
VGIFGPELKNLRMQTSITLINLTPTFTPVFVKRCADLTNENGKVAMIHPHTFMFVQRLKM